MRFIERECDYLYSITCLFLIKTSRSIGLSLCGTRYNMVESPFSEHTSPCIRGLVEMTLNPEYCVIRMFKRDFAGGPQNKKMTMPDNISSQLVSIDKVVLPQDLGLVSTQDELVKRHFHFLTQGKFLVFF